MKYYNNIYCEPCITLEDICFFDNERLIFGSVSHEGIVHLFADNEKELLQYKKMTNWEEEYFPEIEYVRLHV